MKRIITVSFILLAWIGSVMAQNRCQVLIVYYSAGGHTRTLAEAVARGAESADSANVTLLPVEKATNARDLAADAIILGSPVYNANVSPAIQRFINQWPFRGAPLRDKIGAAFVTAGGISAGEEFVQLSLLRSMLIFGMIVVGGPDWNQAFGASAITEEKPFVKFSKEGKISPQFLAKGEALGRRVAKLACKWKALRKAE